MYFETPVARPIQFPVDIANLILSFKASGLTTVLMFNFLLLVTVLSIWNFKSFTKYLNPYLNKCSINCPASQVQCVVIRNYQLLLVIFLICNQLFVLGQHFFQFYL